MLSCCFLAVFLIFSFLGCMVSGFFLFVFVFLFAFYFSSVPVFFLTAALAEESQILL